MSQLTRAMGAVVPFKPKPSAKLDFKRARRRPGQAGRPERSGQLDLFAPPGAKTALVVSLEKALGPFEQALLLDDRGDPAAADKYRQAADEGDYPADALCNLGILESGAGRKSEAFNCFTHSLKLEPRHFESHYNLANLYFDLGDYRLSRIHYELAQAIDPGYANLYYNLGLVMAVEKAYSPAIRNLHRYAEMTGGDEGRKALDLAERIRRSASRDSS